MPRFQGFIGGSATAYSSIANAERTVNLFPEILQPGNPKSPMALYGTPGLASFVLLDDLPVRALFAENGRCFAVGGAHLYEITSADLLTGTATDLGLIGAGTDPVSISSSGRQLFILSGGNGFIYDLGTQTLSPIGSEFPGGTMGGFMDGYFITLVPGVPRQFNISALESGTEWDGLDYEISRATGDQFSAMLVDHQELIFFGERSGVVFFNSGNPDFPFQQNKSVGVIEQGIGAPWSLVKLDNSLFWLGQNNAGGRMVWRAEGYSPKRVSTHAVEAALRTYTAAQCTAGIGYGYQEMGHSFYVLTFPNATWVYDVSTNLWHERTKWSVTAGVEGAHLGRCQCYCFGRTLIGSRDSGYIYKMSLDSYSDISSVDGSAIPIRRVRRSPHVAQEGNRVFYSELQIDIESGVGPDGGLFEPDGTTPRGPQMMMRFSDNGGKTWSNERWVSAGQLGEYKRRAIWRRLGSGRDRVFEITMTDAVKWVLTDAFLKRNMSGAV